MPGTFVDMFSGFRFVAPWALVASCVVPGLEGCGDATVVRSVFSDPPSPVNVDVGEKICGAIPVDIIFHCCRDVVMSDPVVLGDWVLDNTVHVVDGRV